MLRCGCLNNLGNFMEILAIIVGLLLILKSNILGSFGLNTNSNVPAQVPQGYAVSPQQIGPSQSIGEAAQGASLALSAVNSVASVGSGLAKALPIVGGVISAIIGVFSAASAKRAGEARGENSAVAQAVPAWDQMIAAINSAYNRGQISASDVYTGLEASWNNYWAEVGPQVQPGRNGCQSGNNPPFPAHPSIGSYCTGDKAYGAGCCVAYDSLNNSIISMLAAVKATEQSGKAAPSTVTAVFGSKYGGINRSSYTLVWQRA